MTAIPYDLYESQHEVIIILPLWWVKKDSIEIKITNYTLSVSGKRFHSLLRDDIVAIIQECFRGEIDFVIDLPPNLSYKQIHSSLCPENILTIVIPKNTFPEKVSIHIEEE